MAIISIFHNHTIYSTLAATSHFNELIKVAAETILKQLGMVDLGNLMGAFKFVSEVEKYNGDIKKRKPEAEEKGEEFTKNTFGSSFGL